MTTVPATAFAMATVQQYATRSCRTRHAPALMISHESKLSVTARSISAWSAASSNPDEYGIDRMTSNRPWNIGKKVQKASMTSHGASASASSNDGSRRSIAAQYPSHMLDNSVLKIVSFWLFQKVMKALGGAVNASRCRHYTARNDLRQPQRFARVAA